MKLYELTGNYKELERLIESGEVPAEQVRDTLDLIEGEFNEKAVSIVRVIKNFKPTIEGIDDEIKRLQSMKKSANNRMEWLKDYLRDNMEALGITKIENEHITITCKKPSQSVNVTQTDLIPDEFLDVDTVIKVNKRALLEALKDGREIEGAQIKLSKSPIEIR